MKNKILKIKGFRLNHLLRIGIYRIIFAGLYTQFGGMAVFGEKNADMRMTIGTSYPIEFSGETQYSAYLGDWIFGKCIIIYKKYSIN